eukprot:UN27162
MMISIGKRITFQTFLSFSKRNRFQIFQCETIIL